MDDSFARTRTLCHNVKTNLQKTTCPCALRVLADTPGSRLPQEVDESEPEATGSTSRQSTFQSWGKGGQDGLDPDATPFKHFQSLELKHCNTCWVSLNFPLHHETRELLNPIPLAPSHHALRVLGLQRPQHVPEKYDNHPNPCSWNTSGITPIRFQCGCQMGGKRETSPIQARMPHSLALAAQTRCHCFHA